MSTTVPALLVLEDGRVHGGEGFGAVGTTFGEAVFATGMTGYQETMTDPSYRRQVVVATAPQIGNTGWVAGGGAASHSSDGVTPDFPASDDESAAIWVAGLVIRDLSPRPSNWRSGGSLADEMRRQDIVGIAGVDTRSLTRHLRSAGAMRCGIFSGPDAERPVDELLAEVRASPGMTGADLTGDVTTTQAYVVEPEGESRFTVAALDLGIKANTPRMMAERGITVHVLPADTTLEQIEALDVDGVFLSNGPGDPAAADSVVALTRQVLERRIPFFGICFGNQILGRALEMDTFKLPFGHRGINQPVVDHRTGRVLVSSHNHGFAVARPEVGVDGDGTFPTPFGAARVAFSSLNDGVVEGLECLDVPAFSVQFHPEAAAGPHDARYLFERFCELMAAGPAATGETAAAVPPSTITPATGEGA
ncbi:glutamine-hydrolyzing carbamoyl-phosphate synthase small subunit [Nakamurella flavida]|uniref:Carbamoyl phosphate synthase small chain n=1 Tax=Nakamurella flavida TaxID=363630 RepID=A0A939C2V1_9ACTN|nr:glutamine-hydrolyzing carbamoyl-phosphate synthase small subunit [Nakamurella flavida]MBM9476970.1 glutamine-hydrolyzing carbamoyl-phosphate synthase small subunit [Nakamurella flavida]MDP9779915.1 carbamoyl-phosphate synthase small subunit [Nakamurella flavida]